MVEGDGVAEALLRYAAESGVRSLVLGSASASFRWFHKYARLIFISCSSHLPFFPFLG